MVNSFGDFKHWQTLHVLYLQSIHFSDPYEQAFLLLGATLIDMCYKRTRHWQSYGRDTSSTEIRTFTPSI